MKTKKKCFVGGLSLEGVKNQTTSLSSGMVPLQSKRHQTMPPNLPCHEEMKVISRLSDT